MGNFLVSGGCCCSGLGLCLSGCSIPTSMHLTLTILTSGLQSLCEGSGCAYIDYTGGTYALNQHPASSPPFWDIFDPDGILIGQFLCSQPPTSGTYSGIVAQGPFLSFSFAVWQGNIIQCLIGSPSSWNGVVGINAGSGANPWESGASCSPAMWKGSGMITTGVDCITSPTSGLYSVVITA